ncbi:hypothetical protein CLV91_1387 [Maribacter vaceletii]|uniref:Tetratricopeptide repeat protein n=1 Tax=Maribacter vaceletii TaxID=1206816 RepID=A0A495EEI4_9FLAO|nr:hypothetical protein [Maribacter vaceletii]RKR15304.1 hypothetical protein CLV91_1387 [Maribacter vaceletii]
MNVEDFTYLLKNPNKVVTPIQTNQLEEILEEYPYFQAARALHLKGLKNLNSYKYNNALKITAAYTTDRDVLFNFITSKNFLQRTKESNAPVKEVEIADLNVSAEEIKIPEKKEKLLIEKSEDKPLPQDKEDANKILDPKLFKSKETPNSSTTEKENTDPIQSSKDQLEIGTPLPFNKKEKHSFAQWLQLASFKEINRTEDTPKQKETKEAPNKETEKKTPKNNKFDRIDTFIAKSPKIVPQKNSTKKIDIKASTTINQNELMTQTLAKVYLEQKKYKKAIQAYKILSLKYPEKSSFFADRIKAVEKLQQDNN